MTDSAKILVIDDNEDDRSLYRRVLQRIPEVRYDVLDADGGDSGLDEIERSSPACVLLDYSLPGRNGIEVLKRIRAQHAFVPIVMLTGQGNEKVAVSAMQEGAQNYISKSHITAEDIHRAIQLAISHCAMERRIYEQRQSLEIFTRALAHDLKEPVRTMKSFLSLMEKQETFSKTGQEYFDYIQEASDRMASLIDAVHYYTKLDGAAQQITKTSGDANAVLDEVKLDLAELIRERNAAIEAGPLPNIDANQLQLRQLLQNLISNAIRHSGANPVVRVTATEEPDYWTLSVADNGVGVDFNLRDRIFQPFTRFAHDEGQGLGMGLAICKRIIEAHGGEISCETAPSGGALFVCTFPKHGVVSAPAAKPATAAAPQASNDHEDRPLARVLVIDDNEAAIELARIMLVESASMQFDMLSAKGGEEALAILRAGVHDNNLVDLILLDINMPGMDGFELLSLMQRDETLRGVPVVMCTTSSYDADVERASDLGAAGYITKPPDLNKLRPVFDRLPSVRLSTETRGHALLRVA